MRDERGEKFGWLIGLVAVPLMLLCCGGPVIVAAVVGLGLGTWLAAHGIWIGATAALIVAAAGAIWWMARRRATSCCPPEGAVGSKGRRGEWWMDDGQAPAATGRGERRF